MPGEYKKILRLASKSTIDVSTSALEKGGADGHDWHVDTEGSVTKRPGLVPYAVMPNTDEFAYEWVKDGGPEENICKPYLGVLGAGVFVPDSSVRSSSWSVETLDGINWFAHRAPQEFTFVASGKIFSIRTVPAFLVTGTGKTYTFTVGTSGSLEFTLYTNGVAGTVYTVTLSSTIADIATAIGATLFSQYGQGGLPAYCLVQTDKQQAIQDSAHLYVPCRITYEVPNAPRIHGTGIRQRIFSASPKLASDTPVQMRQYGEWLLLAGQRDRLIAYDGYRARLASCVQPVAFTSTPAGSLTGTFSWILRPKFVSPSGAVSYGVTKTVTATLAVQDMAFQLAGSGNGATYAYGDVASRQIESTGSVASFKITGVLSPSFGFTLDTASYAEDPRPQQNEKLFLPPSAGTQETAVSGYNAATGDCSTTTLVSSASGASTNERVEIYRTLNGGSVYYFVAELPFAFVSYTDSTSDATLATRDVYIETAYTPIATPEYVTSVTTHQNRAVITAAFKVNNEAGERIDSIFYTEPNTLTFTADNSITLNLANGDDLVACYSYDDVLYVASKTGLWRISGDLSSVTSFTVSRLPDGQGAVSNCAIAGLRSSVYVLSLFGVYTTTGAAVDYAVGAPINALMRSLSPQVLSRARLCADETSGRLYITLPGVELEPILSTAFATNYDIPRDGALRWQENAANTTILVFDAERGVWFRYLPKSAVGGGVAALNGQVVMFPKAHTHPIVALQDNYGNDAWTPIEMKFATPWEDGEDPTAVKQFPRVQLLSTSEGSQNFALDVTTETNWQANQTQASFSVGFLDGDGYADVPYATDEYGDPNKADHVEPLTNVKAKSCRLVMRNSDPAEKPTISGWVLEVAANSRNAKET